MEKEYGKVFTAFMAVLFGLFALIRFVPNVQLATGFLSLTFGIVAIIWTYRAKLSLSPGTSLREYTNYFLLSLVFILLFSFWDTLAFIFNWESYLIYPNYLLYPKYLFITMAYLIFVFASYKILYVGKLFGFQAKVGSMNLKKRRSH